MSTFGVGKLPVDSLQKLLDSVSVDDPRVVIGPRLGEDAAVIDMKDRYLIVSADPITFTKERLGWYGVHVNANDVATMGARPRWFFATILFPEIGTDEALIESVFLDITDSCRKLGVTLCGGHTEVTEKLTRPILSGQMLGEVEKHRLVDSKRIQMGDIILLTRGIAIEGTALLARHRQQVLRDTVGDIAVDRADHFLDEPGISVVDAAMTAVESVDVHGMHDPTEGGISNALWELAHASQKGFQVEADAVPVYTETQLICQALGLDAWGLIASGALLIVVDPSDEMTLISALDKKNIPCVAIGVVNAKTPQVSVKKEGKLLPLSPVLRDEIARMFENE